MDTITKFFGEKDLPYYQAGSFRVGSLRQYRSLEEKQDRFSDADEGRYTETYGKAGEEVSGNGYFAGVHFGNFKISGVTKPVCVERTLNFPVFCASCGEYSREVANSIVYGSGSYRGNSDLKFYAEIDLDLFLKAIVKAMCDRMGSEIRAVGRPVEYDDKGRKIVLAAPYTSLNDSLKTDPTRGFVKPKLFECENEYRIAFFIAKQIRDEAPYDLRSDDLKSSIKRIGRIEIGK